MDFSTRSDKKELLDLDDIPFDAIKQNMEELEFINKYLGGHSITIEGFKKILDNKKEIIVCEIGCGGGDNLMAIYKWCKKKNINVKFIGIDINADCIAYANSKSQISNFKYFISDYKLVNFENNKPDIIFSSLFCHHFADEEVELILQWMMKNAKLGIIINDLHRNALAYHSIKFLTRVFSNSYLVKNDAPLSVLRGFTKKDWKLFLEKSGLQNYSLKWRWAFRWLLVIRHTI